MNNLTMLNIDDFYYVPFAPDSGGDSGDMFLATLKKDNGVQYVVKCGYPEIACNEFMYHHVTAALGLYTQEAKLFIGTPDNLPSVGIRYVPNARIFEHDSADRQNRRTFYKFKMLYVILNEDDSEEFYYDAQNRLFKLDNASAFNMSELVVMAALRCGKKKPGAGIMQQLERSSEFLEYGKYGLRVSFLGKCYGSEAAETAFEFIREFSAFDAAKIYPACEFLKNVYPVCIADYYPKFIKRRVLACKQFIEENNFSELCEQ